MSLYTTTSLAEKIGVTYRELDYWVREGFVKPTPVDGESRRAPGTGKSRIWDERDADVALWFARLVRNGMRPGKVGSTARDLSEGRAVYLSGGITVMRTPTAGGHQ